MKTNEGKHNGEEQNRQQAGQVKAKAVDCCGRPTQPGGTGPHLGRSCPRPSRRNTRVDTTRGKQQGTQQLTTAAKGCLLQASRLQQIAATGKTHGGCQIAAPAMKNATHLLKTSQKYHACHTKTIFDTLRNMSECHEVPGLPRETKVRDAGNIQKSPLLQNLP